MPRSLVKYAWPCLEVILEVANNQKKIEDFYASHIKNMVDASVINVRRAKPAKQRVKDARGARS